MNAKHTPVVLAGYEITRDGRIYSTTNWRGLDQAEGTRAFHQSQKEARNV